MMDGEIKRYGETEIKRKEKYSLLSVSFSAYINLCSQSVNKGR